MASDGHAHLLGALSEVVDEGALDVGAPSRLPGWSRGHVLAHIVNSGNGHVRIFEGAARGQVVAQYPGGVEGRAAEIEADSGRRADEHLDALRESCAALERCWAESSWEGRGVGPLGELPLTDMPFLRMREVAIHHVDLGIGYGFADLPAEYVRLEFRRMEMLWRARQPMGMTPLPTAAYALPPPERLAWLMGRLEVDGLAPAAIF